VNHALHCVYDTTECLEEPNQSISQQKSEGEKKWAGHNKSREQSQDQTGHGIELQVLNGMLRDVIINRFSNIIESLYIMKK